MTLRAISNEARTILQSGELVNGLFRITTGWTNPRTYREVRTIFEAWGGRWSGEEKGFRFTYCPRTLIDKALLMGTYAQPRDYGFFPTPGAFAKQLVERAELGTGMKALEPSAGQGIIARHMANYVGLDRVTLIELLDRHLSALRQTFPNVVQGDFLKMIPNPISQFDRIVMNPPFRRQETHVLHAWRFLKPGGRLVAVMAAGIETRQGKIYQRFRDLVALRGSMERNAAGTFKDSGTMVDTVTVTLNK